MSEITTTAGLTAAMQRAARVLVAQADYFTELDQAIGDGDMGITMREVGTALQQYAEETEPGNDLGGWLVKAGMMGRRQVHNRSLENIAYGMIQFTASV